MSKVEFIFWLFLFVIFYSYLGYGILLWCIIRIRNLSKKQDVETLELSDFEPSVTLIVAAYNEEGIIKEKILNTLQLQYPEDKLHIIFITDGSTDNTPIIVKEYKRILLLHEGNRGGKLAAMHRAMAYVKTPIVIFSDANTHLNKESIKHIVKHYRNPKVGGVAGEKKIRKSNEAKLADTEGIYWKYESALKKLDSDFYTVVGAAGELFSIRTELYNFPGKHVILDDLVISLKICEFGYRVAYEPNAYAIESPSVNLKDEKMRKIRISAGGFQAIIILKELLLFWKSPKLTFQYISHRVLRWTLCPLFLPAIFILNVILCLNNENPLYYYLMLLQSIFYLSGLLGWVLSFYRIKNKVFYTVYYFIFINIAVYLGFFKYLKGKQTVLWDKAQRERVLPV